MLSIPQSRDWVISVKWYQAQEPNSGAFNPLPVRSSIWPSYWVIKKDSTEDPENIIMSWSRGIQDDVNILSRAFSLTEMAFSAFDGLESFHMDEIHAELFKDNYTTVLLLKY